MTIGHGAAIPKLLLGMGVVAASACADIALTTPSKDPTQLLSRATLPYHAINLATIAPYNMVNLAVDARLADNSVAPGVASYSVSDSTVSVDSAGLVTANFATSSPAVIRVSFRYNGQTRRDSAWVNVVGAVPTPLPSAIIVQPIPGELPRTEPSFQTLVLASAEDATHATVPGILIALESSNPNAALVDNSGLVTGVRAGTTQLIGSAFVYDRALQDSLEFTTTEVSHFGFTLAAPRIAHGDTVFTFGTDTARITTGGIVRWENYTSFPLDVVFDDPSAADSARAFPFSSASPTGTGNIAPFLIDSAGLKLLQPYTPEYNHLIDSTAVRARQFNVPGIYPFRSVLLRIHSVIRVCDGPCPR